MENKVAMSKRLEQYFKRIDLLEKQVALERQESALARKELELRLSRTIAAQREELVELRKKLDAECREKRERNVRALTKFDSE